MLNVIGIMLGFTVVGLLLRRFGLVRPERAATLNRLALSVTLPAGIFRSLHAFPMDRSALGPPLVSDLVSFLFIGVGWGVARLLKLSRGHTVVFILSIVFSNTAFMGFPFIAAVYGQTGLPHAVLVDQLGMEPLVFTLGSAMAIGATAGRVVPWRQELLALLRFPPLLTLAAAITWRLVGLPHVPPLVDSALGLLSNATVPIVMISLGLVVRLGAMGRGWKLALGVASLRLVLAPLTAWGLCHAFGLTPLQTAVTTVELGMPTMMFTLMLALRYGLDVELSAAFVTTTLIGSIATLPVWVHLLK